MPSEFSSWSSPTSPHPEYFGARCKTQYFTQSFTQLNLYTVMRYEGRFRVCYVTNGKIVSWGEVHGDATWVRPLTGWEWRGNENGYPYGAKTWFGMIEFRYKGEAAICIFGYGCGPEKHPWVTITFLSNNTITRRSGVS